MSVSYDFEKSIILGLIATAISLIIGLIILLNPLAHGQVCTYKDINGLCTEDNQKWNTTQQMEKKNNQTETKIYENRDAGIKFLYPSEWGNITDDSEGGCQKHQICSLESEQVGTNTARVGFSILKIPKENCNCNSLKEFVRNIYNIQSSSAPHFSFTDDSQILIGKNNSGWQYEYKYQPVFKGEFVSGLNVFAEYNDMFYSMSLIYPNDSRSTLLPEFRKVIDSVEFLPIQAIKKPSFMNTEQTNPSSRLESTPSELQILSRNSFTDSVGYMHVVGEVQNNSPT